MPAFRESSVEVNGVRLHCVAAGDGPLILFLHGFPEFWYAWRRQLASFANEFLAVAPDLRGYNLSDKPRAVEAYRSRVLLEDVRGLADHFRGGRELILVGHDWGGALAWGFAMTHPEYLRKLITINAPHPTIFSHLLATDAQQQQASEYMLLLRSSHAERILARNNYGLLRERVLSPLLQAGVFTRADETAYLDAWSQPGALTGALNYYRASRLVPPRATAEALASRASSATLRAEPAERTLKVPTLVIWGERDTALTVRNLEGLEALVPNLSVQRIADGSHWVVHEKPAQVDGYIRAFIGQ